MNNNSKLSVLFTGCTSIQSSPSRTNSQLSKIDVPASIVDALRSRGHDVDWHRVHPGDDLSSYDVAWLNLAPINSLNGRAGAMGTLYAMSSGLPCVGFFDDWQFPATFNGMRAVMRKPAMLYKHMLVGAAHRGDEAATYYSKVEVDAAYERIIARDPKLKSKVYRERYYMYDKDEQVQPYADRLVATAAGFDNVRWERGMVPVVPMYSWGDRMPVRKRMPKTMGPIEPLDPSSTIYPLIAPHDPLPPDEKKREWMLGALMPHDAWLTKKEYTWPVAYMGAKGMVKKYGGERVKTESEVLDRYNKTWGILSPPYPHAGCGWWRSRFMYSARVRSVLVCDKGEGDPLGDSYKVRMAQVEQMTTPQLTQLAEDQAGALRGYMPDPSKFADHCEHIVYRAAREDSGWTYDG